MRGCFTMSMPVETDNNKTDSEYTKTIDTSGLNCPQPLMLARAELRKMQSQETLLIISTDPECHKDFKAFSSHTNYNLLQFSEIDGKYHVVIQCN